MAFERPGAPEEIDPLLSLARQEIDIATQNGRPIDSDLKDEIAALVYDRWREENEVNVPISARRFYGDLTAEEKAQYIEIVDKALQK